MGKYSCEPEVSSGDGKDADQYQRNLVDLSGNILLRSRASPFFPHLALFLHVRLPDVLSLMTLIDLPHLIPASAALVSVTFLT
jgi:hypothetical protein